MSQRRFPISEQVTGGYPLSVHLPRLDADGFAHLRELSFSPERCRDDGRGQDVCSVRLGGIPDRSQAAFSGVHQLFSGSVFTGMSASHLTVAYAANNFAAWEMYNRRREERSDGRAVAGIIGLVSGNGLCWYSPARTPVFANEFAQFLLDRTSTLSPSRIMAGSALIMLTADVADIIAGHRAYLLGPIVVEANNQLADDELRLTLPEDPNPVLVEYFAPGLSPLDLETYSSLRRSGLSQDDALHAVALLDARHKSEHV